MIKDLKTKVDQRTMEGWLVKQENRHLVTGLKCRTLARI